MWTLLLACVAPPGDSDPDALLAGSGGARGALPDLAPTAGQLAATGDHEARRVVWALADDATIEGINAASSGLGARLAGTEPVSGLLLLDVDDIDAALAAGDASPHVAVAARSRVLRPQGLPADHDAPTLRAPSASNRPPSNPDYQGWEWTTLDRSGSWGLKFIHAPAAWNLRPRLAENGVDTWVLTTEDAFANHTDLSLAASAPRRDANPFHGNTVAGVIAAHWDDAGIEGVFPAASDDTDPLFVPVGGWENPRAGTESDFRTEIESFRWIRASLESALDLGTGQVVFNQSYGDTYGTDAPDSRAEAQDRSGRLWHRFAGEVELLKEDWLYFCSAGNNNLTLENSDAAVTYAARYNSGCANAAVALNSGHFLAIEALKPPGDDLAAFSERGGTLAAPGWDIGLVGTDGGYVIGGGTSQAAPMAAGAALVAWTLFETASYTEVRAALLDGARPPSGASAPRLDLWGALLALDTDGELLRYVADVDDRTVDGSLRATIPGGLDLPWGGERGDGCVDMRDLRAFRDAWLDARLPGWDALEGDPDHALRDGNGDGRVAHTTTGDPPEANFSRFDLDGDGDLDEADLGVLARVWGTCADDATRVANTEGWSSDDLPNLLNSLDVWVAVVDDARLGASTVPSFLARAADTDRKYGAFYQYTVPLGDGCRPSIDLRFGHRVQPVSAPRAGQDVVVDWETFGNLAGDADLVAWRTGGEIDEVALFDSGSSYAAIEGLTYPWVTSPLGGEIAGSDDGALIIASSASNVRIPIAGLSSSVALSPWQWSWRGAGVLGRDALTASGELVYVDVHRGTGWRVAPDVAREPTGWPTVGPDDLIYFVGMDKVLYRLEAEPSPQDLDEEALLDVIAGATPLTCPDGAGASAEVVADFSSHGTVEIAGAVPYAASAEGDLLMRIDGDLWAVAGDGTGQVRLFDDLPLRGGVDVFDPFVSHGLSWSPDGRTVAAVDSTGVWLLSLGDGPGLPTEAEVVATFVSPEVGNVVFSPDGDHLLMLGHAEVSDMKSRLRVLDRSGTERFSATHFAWGAASWSGDGSQLAYCGSATDSRLKADLVVVSAAGGDVFDTATWSSSSGSLTQERYVAWAADVLPW